ncbi:MAG: DUF3857 domain-containing protein [Myxococcaceae bacterium]
MNRFLCSFAIAVLLAAGVAGAETPVASAPATDPTLELARQYAQEALTNPVTVRNAAPLIRLHALRDDVDDLNVFAQVYWTLLSRRQVDPSVRMLARTFAAEIERTRGKTGKSAEMMEPLGYLSKFYVVGGFDNEGKGGCDTDFGPEGGLDLKASYPTRGRDVTWQKLNWKSSDGFVDLGSALRPNNEAIGYALTFLDAPDDTKVALGLGTSGAYRLWVNGQKVASDDRYNVASPDQARVSVRLRKGTNRVLLKICQESGPLGFFLRQERIEGEKGPLATSSLPETLPNLEKGVAPGPQQLPTLTQQFEREVKKDPNNAQLRADYAIVLAWTRAFEEKEHSDTVEAEKAADLAPNDDRVQLTAAEHQREEHNLRRKHLELALAADPKNPIVRYQLAQHELNREFPDRALNLIDATIADFPRFAEARLLRIRALEALERTARAWNETEETFRAFGKLPHVVDEAARASRRIDRAQESMDRMRVALALRYDDASTRRSLALQLADVGRVSDAEKELETQLRLDPFDNNTRLQLAELYAANGQLQDAEDKFKDAKMLCPDEPEVHEREGRALLEAGRKDDAIAAFERSLQLRPQNPALKEAVRSIKGETGALGAQYAVDIKPLLQKADSFAGEDAVYLVDNSYTRVQSSGLSSRFTQIAVKVYTQRGVDAFRSQPITFSPNRQEVRVLKARVLKPDGSIVDSYGEQERNINEPWTGMYYDARARVISFPQLSEGDVLELQYRLDDTAQENLLSDYWGDVDYVQASSPKVHYQFSVEMPAKRPLYWNKEHLGAGVGMKTEALADGRQLYQWTADNVPKVTPEPSMPGYAEVATTLHVSTYQTWDQVGRYYWGLVRDQLVPNEDLKKTVEAALKGVDRKDDLAVVRALYDFVVTNTRYVALEFGIHGYKPYRVDRILARRFGDCKDKASLMSAMLKVAGIDNRLVLLRMRHLGDIGAEPASLAAFNHAILYVPKFDMFLDGTAEFYGAKELPYSDRTANVLVVNPDGDSKFYTTPEAAAEDNLTDLSIDVALAADGTAKLNGKATVTGQGAPDYRRTYQAAATRKATFEQSWASQFPGLTVDSLKLSDLTKIEENVSMEYQLSVPRFSEVLGNGLRFYPFGTGRAFTQGFAALSERKYDVVFPNPFVNKLNFTYALPAGYTAAQVPADVQEDSPFGRARISFTQENGKIAAHGEIAFTSARIKAADYAAFRSWLIKVDQAFNRKITLQKPGGQTAAR